MKKNDIYLIVFLLFLSLIVYFTNHLLSQKGKIAVIYLNNKQYAALPLDEDKTININNTNTVCVKDGKVFMEQANCPDQICVHQKPLDSSERDIVCLPNKITVKIIKNSEDSLDTVSR